MILRSLQDLEIFQRRKNNPFYVQMDLSRRVGQSVGTFYYFFLFLETKITPRYHEYSFLNLMIVWKKIFRFSDLFNGSQLAKWKKKNSIPDMSLP